MTGPLAVLSTGRQDWGILRTLCGLLKGDAKLDLRLILGGMHCSDRFGRTSREVVAEGFAPDEQFDWIPREGPLHPEVQAADAVRMVADGLKRQAPLALLVVGDRFETAAAALAATLLRIPLVHLHGGEETEGAIDNALRHAISKLSHLHFTSHPDHSARLIGFGEDPATVHTVGAPGLDNLHRRDLPTRAELERDLGITLTPPVVIVTLHPTTLGSLSATGEAEAMVKAMDAVEATYIVTLPNTDPGSESVRERLLQAVQEPRRRSVEALGERRYWGLMRCADAMLGNSSSALIEAPALHLPAVNIGERQRGRLRGGNVIDAAPVAEDIAAALHSALEPGFRRRAAAVPCPFGDGHASQALVSILRAWTPPNPPVKVRCRA